MVGDRSYLPRLSRVWVFYYPVLLADLYGKINAVQRDRETVCEG